MGASVEVHVTMAEKSPS